MKNDSTYLSLVVVVATAACSGASSSPPSTSSPAASTVQMGAASGLDPENATFADVCTGTGTMTAKAGQGALDRIEGSPVPGAFEVETLGRLDLDGDGRVEVLARVSCSFGGSGGLDAVWALHEVGDHLETVDRIPGGDRADGGLAKIDIRGDLIVVERNAGGESACCADKTVWETWGFSKNRFEKRAVQPPVAAPPSPAETLAIDLLTTRDLAGWSATKHQVAVATTVWEEGTGTTEWTVRFVDVATKKEASKIEVCGKDHTCTEEVLAAARPVLAKLLDGFVGVSGVAFEGNAEKALPGGGLILRATGPKIDVRNDKGQPKILVTLERTSTHAAELTHAWHLPAEHAVLLRVRMNPGERLDLDVDEEAQVYALPKLAVPSSR